MYLLVPTVLVCTRIGPETPPSWSTDTRGATLRTYRRKHKSRLRAAARTATAAAMEEPPRHEDHEDDAIVARAHARWGPRGWSSNVARGVRQASTRARDSDGSHAP